MRIVQTSIAVDGTCSALTLANALRTAIRDTPDWLILFHTGSVAPELAQEVAKAAFPNTLIHGCSSSSAVFGGGGLIKDPGISVLAIIDPMGAFGVSRASFAHLAPAAAARQAVEQALSAAGRSGAIPDFIWLSAIPGCEEAIIAGIEEVVGDSAPIVGGSAALNGLGGKPIDFELCTLADGSRSIRIVSVGGRCVAFDAKAVVDDGLVLSVGFISGRVSHGFLGGFSVMEPTGVVTEAVGRVLLTIDGEPAAQAYNRWSGGLIAEQLSHDGNVVTETTLRPLGVTVGQVGNAPLYGLAHPVRVENGALWTHAAIPAGSRLNLMAGDQALLINRCAELVERTRALFNIDARRTAGALIAYCAGCARPLGQGCEEMVERLKVAMHDAPFMGGFFFGEQGRFWNNRNAQANLMVSLLLFENRDANATLDDRTEFSPPAFQNELALGYQIVKARLDQSQRLNRLLCVGLAKIAQAREQSEVFAAVSDSMHAAIKFDGFAILRAVAGVMTCTLSSAWRLKGAIWRIPDGMTSGMMEKPLVLGNASHSSLWLANPDFFQALNPGSAIHVSFVAEHAPFHILLSHRTIQGLTLTDGDILWVMIPFIRQALENVAHLQRMEVRASTDSLTGINNRAYFLELASQELARSKRFTRPTSVLMLDVDHFKKINDERGHAAGDAALRCLAKAIEGELRAVDILGRLGGEEFGALIAEADQEKALQIGERICKAVESTVVVYDGCPFKVTISVGIAASSKSLTALETLLIAADHALYLAKQKGRNRMEHSDLFE